MDVDQSHKQWYPQDQMFPTAMKRQHQSQISYIYIDVSAEGLGISDCWSKAVVVVLERYYTCKYLLTAKIYGKVAWTENGTEAL